MMGGRSHPAALLTTVARTLREECELVRGQRLLVAVSGGGDSLALLHCLARLAPKLGFELVAHGVDHGLRAAAPAELDLAEALAKQLGVVFTRSHVQVGAGSNLQARARRARYRALRAAAQALGAQSLATAHHADDRAETVLLRLLRGAGPAGLAVLPARSDDLLRPMIRARKSAVLAHLARHKLAFADDPSNRDRRFLRVRVREELMPLLQDLSPGVVDHLLALADQLADAESPALFADGGAPVQLGRAQIALLRRAQKRGQYRARVRLPGGREARIDPKTGHPVLCSASKRGGSR